MKLKFLLLLFFAIVSLKLFSHQFTRSFAITGQSNGNFNLTDIRILDMVSGNANTTLFENGKTKFSFVDAETRKTVDQFTFKGYPTAIPKGVEASKAVVLNNPSPTTLMSAAAAYDKRHDKLFFAAMRTGQLVWLDLRANNGTPSFYTIQKTLINNVDYNDESLNITRMTIGADGNGYALT